MTDQRSPLDHHIDAYRDQLRRSAVAQARTRRRRVRAAGIAVPIAAATFATTALWPGDRTTVLERAAAALKPASQVVHYSITGRSIGGMQNAACSPAPDEDGADEFWQETTADPRWRWRQHAMDPKCGIMSSGLGNTVVGASETAYDGAAVTTSNPGGRWVERITEPRGEFKEIPDLSGLGRLAKSGGAGDPVSWLSNLMGSGTLKVSGHATIDGRRVLMLIGHIKTEGRPKITVSIDPKTYVPVRVVQQVVMPRHSGLDRRIRESMPTAYVVDFLTYEPATEADLRPQLPPDPHKTETFTQRAWRQEIDRRQRAESRKGHALALRLQKAAREHKAKARAGR
ncbi:MAG: hypothetical protein PGN13_10435 [Patulibacter minatonensis]